MAASSALLQCNGKDIELSEHDLLVITQALNQHRNEINGHIQHMGYVKMDKENFKTLMSYYDKRKELCSTIINKLSCLAAKS